MDYSALVNEVVEKSKPPVPKCSVCGAAMNPMGFANGQEEFACSKVKVLNQQGDSRPFDPTHYAKSVVKRPFGIDPALLRKELSQAFGKVEAEIEKRIRDEQTATSKPAQEKPVEKPEAKPKEKEKKVEKELLLEKDPAKGAAK